MKKLLFIPLLFVCFNAYAVLTSGYIPVTKTGGTTTTTQNSDITDSGGVVKIGTLTTNGCVTTSGSNGTLGVTTCGGAAGGSNGQFNYNNSGVFAGGNMYASGNNIGIGSSSPGQILDVQGTVRTTGFQLTTSPTAGYVLTSSSVGIGTWQPAAAGVSGANPSGTVGLSAVNGSATTYLRSDGAPALSVSITPTWTGTHTFNGSPIAAVFGGNVGIGSATPGTALDVNGTVRMIALTTTGSGNTLLNSSAGNVAVGTTTPVSLLAVNGGVSIGTENNSSISAPTNGLVVSGNVAIGTTVAGNALQVNGTGAMTGFQLSTSPTAGYVLTSSSVGIGTWQPASSGTATTGTNILFGNGSGAFTNATNTAVSGGNIGIGTITLTSNLLTIGSTGQDIITTSGNVGIGTNVATTLLQVGATGSTGNVGINSSNPGAVLDVEGGNVGIGSSNPGVALDLGTGAIRIGIGTTTAGTILCVKTIANSRATIGYCTSTLTGDICATCN